MIHTDSTVIVVNMSLGDLAKSVAPERSSRPAPPMKTKRLRQVFS